jgi:hypothetical protein
MLKGLKYMKNETRGKKRILYDVALVGMEVSEQNL